MPDSGSVDWSSSSPVMSPTHSGARVLYVDPELAKDAEQDGLNTITLSYTMHAVRKPVAESNGALPPGRS